MAKKTILFIIAAIILGGIGDFVYQSKHPVIAPEQSEKTESQVTFCEPAQRQGDVCFQLYDPVCAKVNIQCIKAPCDPVNQTFSNGCEACRNPLVESYTKGECPSVK